MFPDASGGFPPSPTVRAPFNFAPNPPGLFGNSPNILNGQSFPSGGLLANAAANTFAAPTSNLSTSLLFGGTGPAPAGTETPWPSAPRHGLLDSTEGLSSSFVPDQTDPSNVGAPPVSSRRSPDPPLPGSLQDFFSGLAQPAIGSINDPAYLVPVADKRKDPRNLDLFDERAFGNTPPLGSAAPKLIPPTSNAGPRPPTASPQPPPAQAPSAPRASLPAAQAQSTLPGIPPPSGAPAGEPPEAAKAGAAGGGASSSAVGPGAPPDANWRQLVQNIERIRDARTQEDEKLQAAISAALPKYNGKTYGVLVTNEGDVVPLRSGSPDPLYSDYTPARHVEGKAAIWIREHGSTGGVVYHNNTEGTCGLCISQAETLLPEGASLRIVPPAGAVPKNERAVAVPSDHVGDANVPKPPRQGDFFVRQP